MNSGDFLDESCQTLRVLMRIIPNFNFSSRSGVDCSSSRQDDLRDIRIWQLLISRPESTPRAMLQHSITHSSALPDSIPNINQEGIEWKGFCLILSFCFVSSFLRRWPEETQDQDQWLRMINIINLHSNIQLVSVTATESRLGFGFDGFCVFEIWTKVYVKSTVLDFIVRSF